MTVQTALNEYQAGKLEALEILLQFVEHEQKRGRQYFSCDQLYQVIRSLILNCQEKWK